MVAYRGGQRSKINGNNHGILGLGMIALIGVAALNGGLIKMYSLDLTQNYPYLWRSSHRPPAIDYKENSDKIKRWRRSTRNLCAAAKNSADMDLVYQGAIRYGLVSEKQQRAAASMAALPFQQQQQDELNLIPCQYVFLDLATDIDVDVNEERATENPSQALMQWIDVGLRGCTPSEMVGAKTQHMSYVHWNIEIPFLSPEKEKEHKKHEDIAPLQLIVDTRRDPVTERLDTTLSGIEPDQRSPYSNHALFQRGPEDYCYYATRASISAAAAAASSVVASAESNTQSPFHSQNADALRYVEDLIMSLRPRPVRHMHYLTETIVSLQDGIEPITFHVPYDNYGRKNQNENLEQEIEVTVNVTTYKLASLLEKTVQAFHQEPERRNLKSQRKSQEKLQQAPQRTITGANANPLGPLGNTTDNDEAENNSDGGANHIILKLSSKHTHGLHGGTIPINPVLVQAHREENLLCPFVQQGHSLDIFMYFPTDNNGSTDILKELTDCGVTLVNMASF